MPSAKVAADADPAAVVMLAECLPINSPNSPNSLNYSTVGMLPNSHPHPPLKNGILPVATSVQSPTQQQPPSPTCSAGENRPKSPPHRRIHTPTSLPPTQKSDVVVEPPTATPEEEAAKALEVKRLIAWRDQLEETLMEKLEELKRICISEGELTGMLPEEIYKTLLPGEAEPQIRKRVGTTFKFSQEQLEQLCADRESSDVHAQLEADIQLHRKIVAAAGRLAAEKSVNKSVRKKRRKDFQAAAHKLKALERGLERMRLVHVGGGYCGESSHSRMDYSNDNSNYAADTASGVSEEGNGCGADGIAVMRLRRLSLRAISGHRLHAPINNSSNYPSDTLSSVSSVLTAATAPMAVGLGAGGKYGGSREMASPSRRPLNRHLSTSGLSLSSLKSWSTSLVANSHLRGVCGSTKSVPDICIDDGPFQHPHSINPAGRVPHNNGSRTGSFDIDIDSDAGTVPHSTSELLSMANNSHSRRRDNGAKHRTNQSSSHHGPPSPSANMLTRLHRKDRAAPIASALLNTGSICGGGDAVSAAGIPAVMTASTSTTSSTSAWSSASSSGASSGFFSRLSSATSLLGGGGGGGCGHRFGQQQVAAAADLEPPTLPARGSNNGCRIQAEDHMYSLGRGGKNASAHDDNGGGLGIPSQEAFAPGIAEGWDEDVGGTPPRLSIGSAPEYANIGYTSSVPYKSAYRQSNFPTMVSTSALANFSCTASNMAASATSLPNRRHLRSATNFPTTLKPPLIGGPSIASDDNSNVCGSSGESNESMVMMMPTATTTTSLRKFPTAAQLERLRPRPHDEQNSYPLGGLNNPKHRGIATCSNPSFSTTSLDRRGVGAIGMAGGNPTIGPTSPLQSATDNKQVVGQQQRNSSNGSTTYFPVNEVCRPMEALDLRRFSYGLARVDYESAGVVPTTNNLPAKSSCFSTSALPTARVHAMPTAMNTDVSAAEIPSFCDDGILSRTDPRMERLLASLHTREASRGHSQTHRQPSVSKSSLMLGGASPQRRQHQRHQQQHGNALRARGMALETTMI